MATNCKNGPKIYHVAAADGNWLPIVTPVDCNFYTVTLSGNGLFCSDTEDAGSTMSALGGVGYGIEAGNSPNSIVIPRFKTGDILIFVKMDSPPGTIQLVCEL